MDEVWTKRGAFQLHLEVLLCVGWPVHLLRCHQSANKVQSDLINTVTLMYAAVRGLQHGNGGCPVNVGSMLTSSGIRQVATPSC